MTQPARRVPLLIGMVAALGGIGVLVGLEATIGSPLFVMVALVFQLVLLAVIAVMVGVMVRGRF